MQETEKQEQETCLLTRRKVLTIAKRVLFQHSYFIV